MDDTSQKIIDATMALIRDKGYVATTTKDIAHLAGVNECTLFRKFKNKKDIVLSGIAQEKWRANITPELFQNVVWELQPDLEMFMTAYMDRITPDFVNLSIGLRAPQLYDEKMEQLGKIGHMDFESLAMTIFSSTFGYTFLKSSFHQELTSLDREQFIKNSVAVFLNGISER